MASIARDTDGKIKIYDSSGECFAIIRRGDGGYHGLCALDKADTRLWRSFNERDFNDLLSLVRLKLPPNSHVEQAMDRFVARKNKKPNAQLQSAIDEYFINQTTEQKGK